MSPNSWVNSGESQSVAVLPKMWSSSPCSMQVGSMLRVPGLCSWLPLLQPGQGFVIYEVSPKSSCCCCLALGLRALTSSRSVCPFLLLTYTGVWQQLSKLGIFPDSRISSYSGMSSTAYDWTCKEIKGLHLSSLCQYTTEGQKTCLYRNEVCRYLYSLLILMETVLFCFCCGILKIESRALYTKHAIYH
jgi:hypothetical protein